MGAVGQVPTGVPPGIGLAGAQLPLLEVSLMSHSTAQGPSLGPHVHGQQPAPRDWGILDLAGMCAVS